MLQTFRARVQLVAALGLTLLLTMLPIPVFSATFNVLLYGAVADGKDDDSVAIQKTIDAAIAAGSGNTVYVPAGRYLLAKQLEINNSNSLVFTGASRENTVFLTTPKNGLVVDAENNKNLTLSNFSNDGEILNFTQGVITAFSKEDVSITLRIDSGYQQLDAPLIDDATTVYTFWDANRKAYDGPHPAIRSKTRLGDGTWQLKLDSLPTSVYVGEKVAIWNRNDIPGGITYNIAYNHDVTFENIADYCGGWNSAGAFVGNQGAINVINFYEGPPPGTNRLITSGGGTICYNHGALTLTGCDFSEIDDDCLDIGGGYFHIISQSAPNVITAVNPNFQAYQVGDTVQIWDWASGDPSVRNQAIITSISSAGGNAVLTLSQDVSIVHPDGDNHGGGEDGFDRIIDLTLAGPVKIDHCRLQSDRARAALVKSGVSIIVQDCTIYGCRMPALNCGMEEQADEGPETGNLTVADNTFYGNDGPGVFVGTDEGYSIPNNRHIVGSNVTIVGNRFLNNCIPCPTIGSNPQIYDYPCPVYVTMMQGVHISSNRFFNNWGPNIALDDDADVDVSSNLFYQPNNIQGWTEQAMSTVNTVIFADDTHGLQLASNRVIHPGAYCLHLLTTTAAVDGIVGVDGGISIKNAAH